MTFASEGMELLRGASVVTVPTLPCRISRTSLGERANRHAPMSSMVCPLQFPKQLRRRARGGGAGSTGGNVLSARILWKRIASLCSCPLGPHSLISYPRPARSRDRARHCVDNLEHCLSLLGTASQLLAARRARCRSSVQATRTDVWTSLIRGMHSRDPRHALPASAGRGGKFGEVVFRSAENAASAIR